MESIPIRKIHSDSLSGEISNHFKTLRINQLVKEGSMYQPVHRHDFYFLMVIEKGYGTHQIDFSHYDVEDYLVFLMRPGQVHSLELSAGTEGYIIGFSPSFICSIDDVNPLLRKIGRKNLFKFNKSSFTRFKSIVESFFKESDDKHSGYEKAMTNYLNLAFIELGRLDSDTPSSDNLYLLQRLEEFQELVELKIPVHKKVSEYAKMMSLTSYQLNRITKTTLNKTCSELINEQIILESKRQLLSTSNQINQIAFMLGYEDVSYFTRFFKRHAGYSPGEFKEKFK